MSGYEDPGTEREWQLAVNAAWGILAVEVAVAFGFVEPRGDTHPDRCIDIVLRARQQGIEPSDDAILQWVGETSDEAERERIYAVVKKTMEIIGDDADLAECARFLLSEECA